MDPKSTTLDPKLKEVYDRVMGTSTGSTPAQGAPAPVLQPAPKPMTPPMPATAQHTQTPMATPVQEHPSAFPPPKSSLDASSAPKSAVDYAALAAKYATPAPAIPEAAVATPPAANGGLPPLPTRSDSAQQATNAAVHAPSTKPDPAVATFSATVQVPTNSSVPAVKNSSSLLKIALIAGVPIFLIAYTAVWMVVFKVDIMKLLPGA